ncbi:MAG: hypothetical protein H7124_01355 [Phycisphaerales bacterium]|nr:hypothetical protein [Hyphomonadaceae bacterium]
MVSTLYRIGEAQNDVQALSEAVEGARELLRLSPRRGDPDTWAGAQWRLGNALRHLGEVSRDRGILQEAALAFQGALEVYTREHEPVYWVWLQNNLGNALRLQTEFGDRRTLSRAIECYRLALSGADRATHLDQWIAVQANLAISLRMQGGEANIEESILTLRDVVALRDRRRTPGPWAYAQLQLARSLAAGTQREPSRRDEAIVAARAAETMFNRLGQPTLLGESRELLAQLGGSR